MSRLVDAWRAELGPHARAVFGLILIFCAFELAFGLLDARPPQDPNAVLTDTGPAYRALVHGDLLGWLRPLASSGGWQEVALATAGALTGRAPVVWRLYFLGWALVATLSLARAATSVHPRAALPAVAIFLGYPLLVEQVRLGWLHLPELALLAVAGAELLRPDRGRSARVVVAVALLVCLRGSALVWGGAVAAAALVCWWPERATRRRALVALVVAVLIGMMVTGREIPAYAAGKVASAKRYEFLGGAAAFPELARSLGPLQLPVLAIGLGAGWGAWPSERRRAWGVVLGLGVGVPFVSATVLSAPVTNTPVLLPALALLAGVGLAAWPRRATVLVLATWLPLRLLQFLPAERLPQGFLPIVTSGWVRDDPVNVLRPWRTDLIPTVRSALDTCLATRPRCAVLAETGILHPSSEEPGLFALWYYDYDERVLLGRMSDPSPPDPVDAVVRYQCPTSYPNWLRRYPRAAESSEQTIRAFGLVETLSIDAGSGCTWRWFTTP